MQRETMKNVVQKTKYEDFDPNSASSSNTIFGLPFDETNAKLILLPIPFEATTSYAQGTACAPENILKASQQVDLYHLLFPHAWKKGIAMLTQNRQIQKWNKESFQLVKKIRESSSLNEKNLMTQKVNRIAQKLNHFVQVEVKNGLDQGKRVGLIGGDHSIPFGAIKEMVQQYPDVGILHIDAHFDLRKAYEGFTHSHASIMYNVMTECPPKTLVQVGIRDFCEEEWNFVKNSSHIHAFLDRHLFQQKMNGKNWKEITEKIVSLLPQKVYVSFDIDGLAPHFCPGTGTPVPGGLSYHEAIALLEKVIHSGRTIVAFDLTEVGPTPWDGNVGARILYELCVLTLKD